MLTGLNHWLTRMNHGQGLYHFCNTDTEITERDQRPLEFIQRRRGNERHASKETGHKPTHTDTGPRLARLARLAKQHNTTQHNAIMIPESF